MTITKTLFHSIQSNIHHLHHHQPSFKLHLNSFWYQKSRQVHSNLTDSNRFVQLQQLDELCVIRLNRASNRNAINRSMVDQLVEVLIAFDQKPQLKVAVLTGAEGNLSIGLDYRDFRDVNELKKVQRLLNHLPTSKPLIAAIEGYSTCLAFQLASLCDLRVSEVDAIFGLHSHSLPLFERTKRVLRCQKKISSIDNLLKSNKSLISLTEAYESGFVNELTKVGCALGRSIELAKSLVKFSQTAIKLDRSECWNVMSKGSKKNFIHHDWMDSRQEWEKLAIECKIGAERFLYHGIGRHGSNQLHTLEEIYESARKPIFEESELIDFKLK